jgi:hypothetical protein
MEKTMSKKQIVVYSLTFLVLDIIEFNLWMASQSASFTGFGNIPRRYTQSGSLICLAILAVIPVIELVLMAFMIVRYSSNASVLKKVSGVLLVVAGAAVAAVVFMNVPGIRNASDPLYTSALSFFTETCTEKVDWMMEAL